MPDNSLYLKYGLLKLIADALETFDPSKLLNRRVHQSVPVHHSSPVIVDYLPQGVQYLCMVILMTCYVIVSICYICNNFATSLCL